MKKTTTATATVNKCASLNTHNTMTTTASPVINARNVIENKTGYTPDIITTINAHIERIYDKPETIPFSACSSLMEWITVNNIHVAIAHSAVNWQANRDGSKYACHHKNDQYTQVVAQKILNGENLVHSMDDCTMDCFVGLQKYANEHGEKACYTIENSVVSLVHDFISSGFRAVSNGMRNNASVQGIHETAIEIKDNSGKWIEVALSPTQLGKYSQWECDILVADIVRNICDNLPTEDHKKWLLCRMSGYKKTEIQKELGVSRQKCRELEKVVISIGKRVVDYCDLF